MALRPLPGLRTLFRADSRLCQEADFARSPSATDSASAVLDGAWPAARRDVEPRRRYRDAQHPARRSRLGRQRDDSTGAVPLELDADENPVRDTEFGFEGDNTPTQVVERNDWTQLPASAAPRAFPSSSPRSRIKDDQKLASAEVILEDWLSNGFNPVVFCRYIATANYVGEQLGPALKKKFPETQLQVITSELPDDLRKQRIEEMGKALPRVLIATDCLSEGINLQKFFTAVLHYDLPWNPNRLEQREGRVDRFGQMAPEVKACLLYGADNPIDGIVLDVLLRKVREIKRATGINVPFPEDSQSIIDTITQALLLNPDRQISKRAGQETDRI